MAGLVFGSGKMRRKRRNRGDVSFLTEIPSITYAFWSIACLSLER
jgi:hypothetical protein